MSTMFSNIFDLRTRSGRPTVSSAGAANKFTCEKVDFWYPGKQALWDISMTIPERSVLALIGPSGCGKSTFLRMLNRMNDLTDGCKNTGKILLDGQDIYADTTNVVDLRRRVGMVFQKSNPFPSSIYENVAYGLRLNGIKDKRLLDDTVEESLRAAALWEESKDRLNESALGLSGGQQQRLCIARAMAVSPEIILMDEPCSALDPIATLRIEELIHTLREKFTIVIVTHNMQQATRCADRTAFFYLGEVIEVGPTTQIFSSPKIKRTEDYISGRFG